jgi:PBP1b-binding outer membrane lipoprotein LpoB
MKKFAIFLVLLLIGCVTCDEDDDCNDKSENEEEELPDHKFITNNNPFKSGPRKGEARITTSLEVAPHIMLINLLTQMCAQGISAFFKFINGFLIA